MRRGEQTEAETEVPTGVETKTEDQTERKTQPETQAEVETEAKSRVEGQTERNEVRSGSAANPLLPKVGITSLVFGSPGVYHICAFQAAPHKSHGAVQK